MCDKCEDSMMYKAGVSTSDAVIGGVGILGRSVVWLSRQLANGSTAAGRGISDEYKRQQQNGFFKED